MKSWTNHWGRAPRAVLLCLVIASAAAAVWLVLSAPRPAAKPAGSLVAATISTPASGSSTAVARSPFLASAATSSTQNAYTLVHGCYSIESSTGTPIAAADGPFTLQAAALGVYLLYTPNGEFLNGGLAVAATPSSASEWTVSGTGAKGFTLTNQATGGPLAVKFIPATGCAAYPEAQVDASGSSFYGANPETDVLGTLDGHAHITAFELFGGDWHCGRPWSPFGVVYALPYSCAADEQGTNGITEQLLDFGGPRPSDFHGWPVFQNWPSPTAIAEEGDYYTGIERAWLAGLRIIVSNDVDNEVLCQIMTTRVNPCNDMESVALQSKDLYALENYIDAQSGGPGKGWFRIVTNPFQARRVINEGKLAVIQGIEVSDLFNCSERDNVPNCSDQAIDDGIKQVESYGVRTFFPIHEFDNAFGGTKGIVGTTGLLVNAGNREQTGSFWNMQACNATDQDAEQTTVPASGPEAAILNSSLISSLTGGAPLPVYSSGPTCNTRGITPYGTYLIQQMIKNHLIIQTDHSDSLTAASELKIATDAHYAGVVSAHCCGSPQLYKGILDTGGAITENSIAAPAFIQTLKTDEAESDPKYKFGFGIGSDMNGLADEPGPTSATPITYPFKAYRGNVTFGEEQWGQRTFNLNTDGVANYGMYADYLNELQVLGGSPVMNAMFQGAEAYLEMWERAYGVPTTSCASANLRFSATGLGSRFRLGDSWERALYRAGQPTSRPGHEYLYCVKGSQHHVVSVFGSRGHVALIGTRAQHARAGAYAAGSPSRTLHPGVNVRGRYVYGVTRGKVSFVAVASGPLLAHRSSLRADLRSAKL